MQRRIAESVALIDVVAVWRERHPSRCDRIRRMRSLSCGCKVHQRNPHFSRRFSCDFSLRLLYKRKLRRSITCRAKLCHMEIILTFISPLTFRHRASSVKDRRFATLQRKLFIYLTNKYISLSDICLTLHH